jgi:hypothetical protein
LAWEVVEIGVDQLVHQLMQRQNYWQMTSILSFLAFNREYIYGEMVFCAITISLRGKCGHFLSRVFLHWANDSLGKTYGIPYMVWSVSVNETETCKLQWHLFNTGFVTLSNYIARLNEWYISTYNLNYHRKH